ncbi:hypothetical protein ACJMK2_001089 [Sinanodonta woodiana]|uniref:C-type lectin domain-containing protein n=1 Tax=Sinanodonta woodiana TaxID=1069815 RepID=A0ABD3XR70_SINWO
MDKTHRIFFVLCVHFVVLFVLDHFIPYIMCGNAAGSCPTGFELHGRKCYIALDQEANWPNAKEYCTIIGGKLAGIANNREQAIIAKLMSENKDTTTKQHYWLDGSDILVGGKWRWMGDRGKSVPFTYTNWYPGEPNFKNERCLEARYEWQSQWNNAPCGIAKRFICEAGFTGDGRSLMQTLLVPKLWANKLQFKSSQRIISDELSPPNRK